MASGRRSRTSANAAVRSWVGMADGLRARALLPSSSMPRRLLHSTAFPASSVHDFLGGEDGTSCFDVQRAGPCALISLFPCRTRPARLPPERSAAGQPQTMPRAARNPLQSSVCNPLYEARCIPKPACGRTRRPHHNPPSMPVCRRPAAERPSAADLAARLSLSPRPPSPTRAPSPEAVCAGAPPSDVRAVRSARARGVALGIGVWAGGDAGQVWPCHPEGLGPRCMPCGQGPRLQPQLPCPHLQRSSCAHLLPACRGAAPRRGRTERCASCPSACSGRGAPRRRRWSCGRPWRRRWPRSSRAWLRR